MSCEGSCSATETAMFMVQSRNEGYDDGLEAGHADKIAWYETQIIGLNEHVQRLEQRVISDASDYRTEIARLKAELAQSDNDACEEINISYLAGYERGKDAKTMLAELVAERDALRFTLNNVNAENAKLQATIDRVNMTSMSHCGCHNRSCVPFAEIQAALGYTAESKPKQHCYAGFDDCDDEGGCQHPTPHVSYPVPKFERRIPREV